MFTLADFFTTIGAVVDYRRATGFETLIGYLYLSGKQERMLELIRTAVRANGQ